ncbi:MAG: polysaccharide pyruvyl transferase family protein [Kiritimatiellae bacterium]|nr:polysaccharide pyruvyl transferase family protein [Kiritimatiellia bacterium]
MDDKPTAGGALRAVTLLGSASGRNAGDAALIAAIRAEINAACGRPLRYEVPTTRPTFIRSEYGPDVEPVSLLPWTGSLRMLGPTTWRSVLRTDLSLIFDAILFDRALWNPMFNFLSSLYVVLGCAHRRGRRFAAYNVGAGPVTTAAGRRMLRELAERMTFITVRDEDSRDVLRELGLRNPRLVVTADAALTAPACDDARADALWRAAGADPALAPPLLAVNINRYLDSWAGVGGPRLTPERFLQTMAEALNRANRQIGARVVLVATQHADVPITRRLAARLAGTPAQPSAVVTNVEHSPADLKGMLRRVELLFGMRLHAMILASSELTPICGLAYQPKVHHYYRRIGLRERSLDFAEFGAESVAAHLELAWRDRAAIRARLCEVVPQLQRRSRIAARLVAAVDRGEDLDAAIAQLDGR